MRSRSSLFIGGGVHQQRERIIGMRRNDHAVERLVMSTARGANDDIVLVSFDRHHGLPDASVLQPLEDRVDIARRTAGDRSPPR